YLVQMGRREEGARLLEQAPGPLSPADAGRAGEICMEAMRPGTAVALLRPAAERNPDAAELQALFGLSLILTGRYPEAVRVLDAVARQAPPFPTLLFYTGTALRLSGDPKRLPQAEAYLRAAAESAPDNGLYQYELGLCRLRLGNWGGARPALEK